MELQIWSFKNMPKKPNDGYNNKGVLRSKFQEHAQKTKIACNNGPMQTHLHLIPSDAN